MQTFKAGVAYFAMVFCAGFALGAVRALWVAPRLGTRNAELIEMPIMLVVAFLAARWTVRRFSAGPEQVSNLGVGFVALALLFVAELTLVIWMRGMTLSEYISSRDPISGTAFLASLVLVALMPALAAR
jgi:hypothetical protein